MQKTKLSILLTKAAQGDWQGALAIAAKFPDLGQDRDAILRGHGAFVNPRFYAQLGMDIEALKALAIAGLKARFLMEGKTAMNVTTLPTAIAMETALTGSNLMALLGVVTGKNEAGRAKTKEAAAKRFIAACDIALIDFKPILAAAAFGEASKVMGELLKARDTKTAAAAAALDTGKLAAAVRRAEAVNKANVAQQESPKVVAAGEFQSRPLTAQNHADIAAAARKVTARIVAGNEARKAALAVAAQQPAKAPVAAKAPAGKRATAQAAAMAIAMAGTLPRAPDFTPPSHKPFRKALAHIVELVEAGDIKALRADTMAPKSSSRVMLCRYRDLAIIALENKRAKAS